MSGHCHNRAPDRNMIIILTPLKRLIGQNIFNYIAQLSLTKNDKCQTTTIIEHMIEVWSQFSHYSLDCKI